METIKISPSGMLKKLRVHELNTNARNGVKTKLLYITRTSVSSARKLGTSWLTAMQKKQKASGTHTANVAEEHQYVLLQDLKVLPERHMDS